MSNLNLGELTGLLAAGGAIGATTLKLLDVALSRTARSAAVNKTNADTNMSEQQRAQGEVSMLREIIAEVRSSEVKKAERIDNLERRLDLLEERERHMLTRAAVHEAWDQMAFALLSQQNPEHPPPPPLVDRNDDHS